MPQSNLEKAFQFDPQNDGNFLFEQRALKNRNTTIRQLALEADAENVSPQRFSELMSEMGKQLFTAMVEQAETDHRKTLRFCSRCEMTELKRGQLFCRDCELTMETETQGLMPYEQMAGI